MICSSLILFISYLLDDGLILGLPEFMAWWVRRLLLHDKQFSFHGSLACRYIEKELLLKRREEHGLSYQS